ncbi:MAG: hypothetical protein ABI444_14685 [Candidatus Kapaibacterium sp.]|jgi:hypothetical protein
MDLLGTKMAPPFRMVSKYFVTATFAYAVLCICLALSWNDIHGHFFQPHLLSLTHIGTLAWITMVIFGAMFQLVPVVLEVPLWSARLGQWQFWIYLTGVIGLTSGMWMFQVGLYLDISAALVAIGGYLFLWNMLRTMLTVEKWDLTGYFLLAGLLYFFITITLGLTLAVNFGHPFISRSHIDFLKIHAHFGLVGWVSMIIMGVAMKLLPMFAISHTYSLRPMWFAFWCVNLGLLGTMVEETLGGPNLLLMIYAGAIGVGLLSYVIQIILVLRVRLRKALDVAMKHAIVSFTFLSVAVVLGYTLVSIPSESPLYSQLSLTYGFIVLFGFISSLIIGELYKIMPFLIWLNKYSPRAGIAVVPTMKEMVNERLAKAEFLLTTAGVVIGAIGLTTERQIVFGVGAALLATASVLFGFTILGIYRR